MQHKIVICVLLCVLTISILGNVVSADDWPMFHHDADHTGYTTSNGPLTNSTLWTFPTINYVESSPAVANGYVYIACGNILNWATNNMVYCINATSGTRVWNFTPVGYCFTPAVANGYVYLGSYYSAASPYDGYLYCLNATTGIQVWNYSAGSFNDVYVPIVTNGYVYVGTSYPAKLLCFNAITGVLEWNFSTSGAAYDVSVSGNYAYVGSNSGIVYCVNALTGASVWNYTTSGELPEVEDAPVAYNGYVYVGSKGGSTNSYNVYCLNAQTGTKVWNFTLMGGIFATVAVANGNVYVAGLDYDLYCLNAQTGAEVWWFGGGGPFESSPAVTASGYLYVGCDDDNVYCLNATDGAEVWHYATGGGVSSSPAIVNGVLYVGSDDQKVYAFGTTQVLQNAKLSIDVSAQNQKTSFLLTISGTLTPAQSGTVTIYETINDTYQTVADEATLSSGAYSIKLRVYNGTFQFYASWPGNSQYNAAVSSIVTEPLNTAIPEFPEPLIPLILAMFILVTLLTIGINKKRHNHS